MPSRWAVHLAGAVVGLTPACRPAAPPVGPVTVDVLPFTVEPASEAWMAAPLAEETVRTLVDHATILPLPPSTAQSAYVLTTNLVVGRVFMISTRLVRVADSHTVVDRAFDVAPASLGTLPGHLASVVAAALGRPLGTGDQPAPTPAYLTYLRALAYRRGGDSTDVRWAAELFRQVIAADSEFAPAWRGLVEALRTLSEGHNAVEGADVEELGEALGRLQALDSAALRAER